MSVSDQDTNVYRLPVPAYKAPVARLHGPLDCCPACATDFMGKCCTIHTEHVQRYPGAGDLCGARNCYGFITRDARLHTLTSITHCDSTKRLRIGPRIWGFLWRRRCDEPGAHLHQSCARCGWHGVLLPAWEV